MNKAGSTQKQYSGVVNAFKTIIKEEGAGALYKGFVPICFRKLLWCSVFFGGYETIEKIMLI